MTQKLARNEQIWLGCNRTTARHASHRPALTETGFLTSSGLFGGPTLGHRSEPAGCGSNGCPIPRRPTQKVFPPATEVDPFLSTRRVSSSQARRQPTEHTRNCTFERHVAQWWAIKNRRSVLLSFDSHDSRRGLWASNNRAGGVSTQWNGQVNLGTVTFRWGCGSRNSRVYGATNTFDLLLLLLHHRNLQSRLMSDSAGIDVQSPKN